jgi:hypothetical protein
MPTFVDIALLAPVRILPGAGLVLVLVDIPTLVVTRRRDGGHGTG